MTTTGEYDELADSLFESAGGDARTLSRWLAAAERREKEKTRLYEAAERAAVLWMQRAERAREQMRLCEDARRRSAQRPVPQPGEERP